MYSSYFNIYSSFSEYLIGLHKFLPFQLFPLCKMNAAAASQLPQGEHLLGGFCFPMFASSGHPAQHQHDRCQRQPVPVRFNRESGPPRWFKGKSFSTPVFLAQGSFLFPIRPEAKKRRNPKKKKKEV